MKYNFTKRAIQAQLKWNGLNKSNTGTKVFAFVQKIVRMINLLFKSKSSQSREEISKQIETNKGDEYIFSENSLQEYFSYTYHLPKSKNNTKIVTELVQNQEFIMQNLSFNNSSSTKMYCLGSQFDAKLNQWIPSLTPISTASDDCKQNPFFKGFATLIFLVLFNIIGVSAQTIDLSLSQTISKSLPTVGESIKYTLWLKNAGPTTASSIVVQDNFPIYGAVLNSHTGGLNFTYNALSGVGKWSVASLAAGDSTKLEINATVTQQGVFFNLAEVFSTANGQTDFDSTPNNSKLNEDDIASTCFSVPLYWYPGEEYTVSIPAPFRYGTNIKWFNGSTQITSGSTVAVVNQDSSLTIKRPGVFSFTTNVSNCPALGCCSIQVVEGPYGSIGDYVFTDSNADGIQNISDTPLSGIKVYLLNSLGVKLDSTITNAQGKYLFDSLLTNTYKIKFAIPTGKEVTIKGAGSDKTKDNDSNPDGTTDAISINTSLGINDIGRNNTTIDAGFKASYGSIGDFIWNDSNNNGLQDTGEAGVSGIIIELYAADNVGLPLGSPMKTDTTDANGKYLFDNLQAGVYVVKVVTSSIPANLQLSSKQDIGANDTIDSDFNPTTGLSDKIVIDIISTKNVLYIDGALFSNLGSIGDFVWKDTNNNGLQDIGELGVKGVKVDLYTADINGNPSSLINTTTTNSDGYYLFTNLPKGNYLVRIIASTLPANCQISTKPNAGDDTKDSDFNPTTGYSSKISIDPSVAELKDNSTIDAAIYTPAVCSELIVSTSNSDICSGDTTYIKGTVSGGGNIKWYLVPTGGTAIATVNNGTNYAVFPTTTTVYYAEYTNVPEGCLNTRQPVVVTVNTRPATPSCICALDICNNTTINLNNYIVNGATTPGGSFEWHVNANPNSPLVSTPTAVGAGSYYLFEKSGAGCYSNPTVLKIVAKSCDKQIDLSLIKSVDNTTPNVGDIISFVIKVTNAGPEIATDVEVMDELPTGLQFVSSAFFTNNAGVLTTSISNIAKNQTITLTYLAKVIGSAAMTNFAQVSKATEKDIDSTPGNGKTTDEDDDDKVIITPKGVVEFANLSLEKFVSNTTPAQGEQIKYTVQITNNGPSNATNVEVTDIVPAGLQVVSATGGDAISTVSNTVVAKFNQIGVGQTVSFQIVTKITATSGTIKNWVQVTKSDQKDPNSTPNNGIDKNEDDDDDVDISIKVAICNPTTPLIACANPYICAGESVSIEAIGCNGTVIWSDGKTGNAITVNPTSTTTYTAQCQLYENCISGKSNPVQVVVNVISAPLITSNSTTNQICNGGNITLTANNCTGTIKWSTGATTPAITVSPSTTTSYTATCTKGTCVSGKSNIITVTVGTTTTPPTIVASSTSICAGQSVTLTASNCNGTILWSNGATTSSITVTPTNTSSYSAVCKVGQCTSNASNNITVNVGITPTPTIIASKSTICAGESILLTASNCNGTILWSNGATASNITVTPTNTSSYSAVCKVGQCTSNASNNVTVNVGVAPTPTITASKDAICAGESVLLTASNCNGTILWSNGATTSNITVTPTSTSSYSAVCKVGQCTSNASNNITVNVGITPTPTIIASKSTICAGESVLLTASNCNGTILWSNGATASSITVTPTNTSSYSAVCKVGQCTSNASNNVTVNVGVAPTPTITASKDAICAGESVILTASNCNGTILWSNGATTSNITITPTNTTTYEVTCTLSNCSGKASKTITTTPKPETPIVTCGKEKICPGESLTFTAHGCQGTVIWSNGASGSTMVVAPTVTTTYTAICTINGCSSNPSKDAVITVSLPTPPTITSTADSVCAGDSVVLSVTNCDGSILWNTGSTSGTISTSPTVPTTYTVKCIVGICESSASKTIYIGGQTPTVPQIFANKTSVCGNETAIIIATGCSNGVVLWSNGATGSTITVPIGTYTAICKTSCGSSINSNPVTIQATTINPPVITSSTTSLCEPGQVTLTATGCIGTVVWSNTNTGTSISVNVASTTTFSAACMTVNCDSGKSNDITITVGKPNKLTISSDKTTVCAGDMVVLTATSCEGSTVWSNGLTGTTITVTPSNTTDYTAVCKVSQGGCTSELSNKITITVTSQPDSPVITCSASRICKGDTLTLNALGCSGTIFWSNGQTSSIINVNPSETTIYTATCKVGSCESAPSAAATITVGNPVPPIVTCKNTQICGGGSTQIEASGCIGTVKWSDGQIGAVITVSPTTLTSYWAICDAGRCQSDKSNVITVQVTGAGLTKPNTKDLVNICPYTTVDLTTGVTSPASSQGGIFVFRTGSTYGSPAVITPSAVGTGTYYVFEKSGNGCYSTGAKINVNITDCQSSVNCATNPATAKAGKDTTLCLKEDYFNLTGQIGGSATSAKWTTDGKGTFDNSLSLNTKYNFSSEDIVKGSVKFTLTTNDPDDNGSCVAATSSFIVSINSVTTIPTIISNKSPNICFGDSVVLTTTSIGSYKWSNGLTTQSITVKTPGRYSLKSINNAGCASLSSNEIVVKLSDAIVSPTVTALTKNICPSTTASLINAITSQPQTTGGIFEFHTGSNPGSPIIPNASAVSTGQYYAFEKSSIGCYSLSAPITVSIDQCNITTDTSKVDVSVEIVGSRSELNIGDPVSYTIKVTNNSTVKTATNINVVNVLPKGLTITSSTPGFTAFGSDSLLSIIGSLPAGTSKIYTYEAKTTKAGKIINTAKITKLDQVEQILSNNISQWTVECKTCQEVCIGTALSADTTRQSNGSYNITFKVLLETCGNVKLEGVKVTENLASMFPLPTTYTIIQKPAAGLGSKLQTNDSFNGSTDINLTIPEGSIVEVGKIDTIKFVINVVPNGKEGPFLTNAYVEGIGNTSFGIPQVASDYSNNGKVVVKESAEPTAVRFYKSPSIGLAKSLSDTTKKSNGSYDITYKLLVKNNGSLLLNNVVLRDTLTKVFKAPATFTVVATPSKNAASNLLLNSAFNGSTDTRLTLPGSTLAVGQTDTLKFTVNLKPDTLKTFANTAVVSGTGTLTSGTTETVTDLSNTGLNPDAPGTNPTNLNIDTKDSSLTEAPCIGVALYVKDTIRQADNSYNIIYKAIIKNCGNIILNNIQVCDTLSKTFTSPAVAKLVGKPTVNLGSLLKVDTAYNGISQTCMLLSTSQLVPNKIDTLTWIVNVNLNNNKGPFRNTVIVTAKTPSGKNISDTSNSGIDPNPVGNTPTVINFNNLPGAIIGISKSVSNPILVEGTSNTYDVTFTFKVKNYGKVAFTGVQVQDNLSVVFGDSVKIDSVKVTASEGFTANTHYTGRGSLINLLVDSLSTLAVNTEKSITLFIRLTNSSSKSTYENYALAIGQYPDNKFVDDLSNTGINPDPDNNGDPRNNSIGTPVIIGGSGGPILNTTLGIAKSAKVDSLKNADGSYNVAYTIIVKNYSTKTFTNVQLSDSLGKVFADSAEFVVVGKPILNKGSQLKVDSTFNGRTITTMLIAENSSLAAGASDTLSFNLRLLSSKKGDATYSNSVTGSANDGTSDLKDISQSGLNPDPDGDNNPGNNNQPTDITIKGETAISDTTNRGVIPQAFSPNGDGKNDLFIIKGINGNANAKAEISIYNRWGQLIYQNSDFGQVEGWNGESNTGIIIGGKGAGVPDGTYFIHVQADGFWENKPQIKYITIVR